MESFEQPKPKIERELLIQNLEEHRRLLKSTQHQIDEYEKNILQAKSTTDRELWERLIQDAKPFLKVHELAVNQLSTDLALMEGKIAG